MRPGAPQVASKSQRPLCSHGDSPESASSLSFLVSVHCGWHCWSGWDVVSQRLLWCLTSWQVLLGGGFLLCGLHRRLGGRELPPLFCKCQGAPSLCPCPSIHHLCWGIYSPKVGDPQQDHPRSLVEHSGGGTVSQSSGAASAAHLLPSRSRSGATSLPGKASRLCFQWERPCASPWGDIYIYLSNLADLCLPAMSQIEIFSPCNV